MRKSISELALIWCRVLSGSTQRYMSSWGRLWLYTWDEVAEKQWLKRLGAGFGWCRMPGADLSKTPAYHVVDWHITGGQTPTVNDLHYLYEHGYDSVICLQTCEQIDYLGDYDKPKYTRKDVEALGMELCVIKCRDGYPPTKSQFDRFLRFMEKDRKAYIHCHAGIGRTGCMLAAYLGEKHKLKGEDAVEKLRAIWRMYIQTMEQWQSTVEYIDERGKRWR